MSRAAVVPWLLPSLLLQPHLLIALASSKTSFFFFSLIALAGSKTSFFLSVSDSSREL